MPDHEHLDPHLDRAFASLTRDLAPSPSPGAAAAISTARRHRRTRVGAVALTAVVAVGGGLTLPRTFAGGGQDPATDGPATAEPTEIADIRKLLPPWPRDIDLEGTLGGWRAATKAASTNVPTILCLDEQLDAGALISAGGGSPWGFSHTFSAYDDPEGGEERVADMVEQLERCSYPEDLQLETLPDGVHLATFDTGGPEGKGALWFAANGDRAGLVGMDGAAEPMPATARQDVADALDEILHLPRSAR